MAGEEVIDMSALAKDAQRLMKAFRVNGDTGLPATRMVVRQSAQFVQQTWIGYASGAPIPSVGTTCDNAEYRNSITIKKFHDLDYSIFSNNDSVADPIENGTEERRMKEELPYKKSYYNSKGEPYSIIPFRHNRKDIAATLKGAGMSGEAKQIFGMDKSSVTGTFTDARGIERYTYSWGARDRALDKKLASNKATKNIGGVYRFETSAGKGQSSSYITFRTLSKNSKAPWIIKAKAGIPFARIVAEQTREPIVKELHSAILRDLAVLKGK